MTPPAATEPRTPAEGVVGFDPLKDARHKTARAARECPELDGRQWVEFPEVRRG